MLLRAWWYAANAEAVATRARVTSRCGVQRTRVDAWSLETRKNTQFVSSLVSESWWDTALHGWALRGKQEACPTAGFACGDVRE